MKFPRGLPLPSFLAFASAVFGAEEAPRPEPTPPPAAPWSLADVALPSSPSVTWGRLENGLRYAIMRHTSPPGRISLRLLVTAGSLHENDDERGFAHFVEHMAFNGTRHFPAGELVRFLQRQGAAFGPHVNADTTPTRTLYKLELDASAASLETGLRIFRDYADGLLFEPAEVRRERGVILSEEHSRHTTAEDRSLAFLDHLYAGTRLPLRHPIGLVPQIAQANAPALRRFYDTWYRPENMGVIIVGEIDAGAAEALVRREFSSVTARTPRPDQPALGTPASSAEPAVGTFVREEGGLKINLLQLAPRTLPLTWGQQLENLRLRSALDMLTRRLEEATRQPEQIFNSASSAFDPEFIRFRKMSVTVTTSPPYWEKSLALVEQEIRRVREHGFSPAEMAYQQDWLRESYQAGAQSHPTTPSRLVAEAIANAMEEEAPYAFVGETLDAALAMTARLTPADCQAAFARYWGAGAPQVFIETSARFRPAAAQVRAVYAASRQVAVQPAPTVGATVFDYEDFGPAGAVAEKNHVGDLDLWQVRFANGVRLNLKRTPFERGLARINVRIGTGTLGEPAKKPGLRFWAAAWWLGGVGRHPVGEINRIVDGLSERNVLSADDALVMTGAAQTANLPRALRVLTAYIADPAFRPEGHRDMAAIIRGQIGPRWSTPEGPLQRFILPTLAGDNPRIGFPAPEVIEARTLDEVRAWLAPQLATGAIEIAVVGDVDVEATIATVARTFGTLPDRQPKPALKAERKVRFPRQPDPTRYYFSAPADRPTKLEFFWPVRDALTLTERHRLPLLAAILLDRVREEVREKDGATYAPFTQFTFNPVYPGFAFIRCNLDVQAAEAERYSLIVADLAARLARTGVTADELARAKAQLAVILQGGKTDNKYWLGNVLGDAQERPERLDDFRTAEFDVAQTTAAELDALAGRYLPAGKVFRYIIDPSALKRSR